MKSRFLSAGLVLGTLLAATPASAQTKWNLPAAYPADNPHSENLVLFAKDVEAATGGKLVITVHPGASLFKAPDIKRAVQTGQTPIGERLLSAHENENPLFGLDSIPFLTSSYGDSERLWQAGRPELEKVLEAQGLVLLYSVPWPPQGLYFKKDVGSAADMAGVKVRSYNNSTGRLAELGGMVPVQIEAAEITEALITGVIDSLITSAVTGQDSKAWEQLTRFYKVNAWQPRNYVIVNKDAWSGLDDKTRGAFKDCAAKAETNGVAMSKGANEKALKDLEQHGMKVFDPPDKLAKELRGFGKTMTDEWKAKAGDAGKAVLGAYAK